jgi:hypothetical protein
MKFNKLLITLCPAFLVGNIALSQAPAGEIPNPFAVATYECASVYWKTPEAGFGRIRYKEVKGNTWKNGLDLVYDSRQGEYRGSIINLIPDTEYQVEFSSNSAKSQVKVKTRSDIFPVGKTTILPGGETDKTVVITESGTPGAYHLVTVPEKAKSVLNLKNVYDYGIEINADYVIVRGVEIRNAARDGIRIRKNRHDIVVEQCYITFWGRMGGPETYGNIGDYDSGVYGDDGTWNLTIHRNLIEYPRGASNDWETGHPGGPQGVSVFQSKGGNVIRYNDILTTEDHGFNDGIGGGDNFSKVGNMNRDADIYGNIIQSVWDDAIECEGANMNVRIWGNYLKQYFMGIASASTTYGPLYMFRNIFAESRRGHRNTMGGSMFKTGEREPNAGGRRYIFHNTALQPNGPYGVISRIQNTITRNNIFDVPGRMPADTGRGIPCDYDYDFLSGGGSGPTQEKHSAKITATPSGTRLFVTSFDLEFYPRSTLNAINWGAHPYEFGERKVNVTDPVIWVKNPMIDGGAVLPGFNDNFKGSAPDIGAFEVGAPPLQFGRRAYLKYDEGWCSWEKF